MKTGILTFHRVYNYGAVLQAYCTQKILDDLGIENEIIDFSMPGQQDFTSMYSTRNGVKRFLKTLLLVPFHHDRKNRIKKFDAFISSMRLSKRTFRREKELQEAGGDYDIYLAGSDQIWNVTKKAEASDAYFLDFVREGKTRLSYAASLGDASYEDLLDKKDFLCQFQNISCREKGGAEILSRITGRNVPVVLDPTLLVNMDRLLEKTKPYSSEPYLLYYSLDGFDKRKKHMDILNQLSAKFGLVIKYLTPEWPWHSNGEDLISAGPEDFLGFIQNAGLVCTNSFHGTALSIRLHTPFYVLERKNIKDERKRSILNQLGLEERILSDTAEVEGIRNYGVDFDAVNLKLKGLQQRSYDYLELVFNL